MNKEQLAAFRRAKAIESVNKKKWVEHFGEIPDTSGIYILTRKENGFKYAYIGQAKHILTRLAQHLNGYQHIDLSLKKHGLASMLNPDGYSMVFVKCKEEELDEKESWYIKAYANLGYQLRNKTSGGQDRDKRDIAENITKGYQQGLHNGYEKARKEIAKLFEKNLTFAINGKPNKLKEKALLKFQEFLQGGE